MAGIPEPHALADALGPRFDGRRVTAAVFLTYTFEPDFFESFVLPVLLPELQLSPVEATALWQLEDALRMSIGDVAVYYDVRGLLPRERSARLDVRRIPCTVSTGYFHPKVLLALTEPADPESSDPEQLVVLVSSANLTQAGWWENVEVAHIEVVDAGDLCSYRADLLHLLRSVRRHAAAGADHTALEAIRRFVLRLRPRKHTTGSGVLYPRLYVGQEPLANWLHQLVPRSAANLCLEVISPYFDQTDARPLNELIEALDPAEVRVFLPEAPDGSAGCDKRYFDSVAEIDGAAWGALPSSLLALGRGERVKRRRVHAKAYHLFDARQKYEAQLVGSVNLTNAAHDRGGNLEAAFLIEEEARAPGWWLTPLASEPLVFAESPEEEQEPQPNARLSVRFDWLSGRGEVFWDDRESSRDVTVTAQGAPQFVLTALPPRKWVEIDASANDHLQESLQVTSFLLIREDASEYTILVDESGMAGKPSVRHELTVADILKSWSLFTPEQRSAFIEERGNQLAETLREMGFDATAEGAPAESFFTLHAGIFLAFGNLERRLTEALVEGRHREVEYWLLGRQYDSLLTLLEHARTETPEAASEAPIREYLMLLCTAQLLRTLLDEHPELVTRYADGIDAIHAELKTLDDVRARFIFDTAEERAKFFSWFEKWFLNRAVPVEAD